MQSFIDYYIEDLLKTKTDLSSGCVVFPTRRAGVIFKKKFAGHVSKPTWLPAVYSIDDFISTLSSFQVADATHLVIELFTIYQQLYPETPFEKYLPWGEMLLKDFNETDLQMADADKLFSQVLSLKEIDLLVGVNEEETLRIQEFWKLFSNQEISKLKNAFLDNWKSLSILYKTFRNQLSEKGLAYSGMAARDVAGKLRKNELIIPWNHVYFAGFYALSNAERIIIDSLISSSKATVRWDADQYYTGDKIQEAGKYFRKKQLSAQEDTLTWTFDYFSKEKRNIHLLGVPLNVGQARYAGVLLNEEARSFTAFDDTAVVIPDEKLLMPVLHSLPQITDTINVTMGYPLMGTPVDELTRILKGIREQHHTGRKEIPVTQLISLLENNYIFSLFPAQAKLWLSMLKKEKRMHVPASFFSTVQNNIFPGFIINDDHTSNNEAAWLAGIYLALLKHNRENKKNEINRLEYGLLKFFYEELDKLSRLIESYGRRIDFSYEVIWKLILDLVRSLRVPFSGEPVKGLQIMGFLETRNLDFDNLLVLSVNEEVMPGNTSGNSYIPFALRKAYGLPTFEEQDAIYAYHFYRLLQRAKNVYLFYNTEAGGVSAGEMSRYILQIAYEMKKKSGGMLNLTHRIVGTDLQMVEVLPIIIKKDKNLQEQLHSVFIQNEKSRKWSATALSSYITCPLQFYLKYIAGIREPDEVKEEIDPAVFGNIVHSVMERFYNGHSVITGEYLQSLIPVAAQAVDDAIRLEFPSSPGVLTGKNSLLNSVMTELVKNILYFDLDHAPFNILGLEKTFEGEIKTRYGTTDVYGKIDRIDEQMGMTRIIDYKTGKDEVPKKLDIRELPGDPGKKAAFQLLFYSFLFRKSNPGKKIKAGLFSLRSRSHGIDFLNGDETVSDEQLQEFELQAGELISSILDPAVDFVQTTDAKRCEYCPYKDICSR